jgi:hypothetical protein
MCDMAEVKKELAELRRILDEMHDMARPATRQRYTRAELCAVKGKSVHYSYLNPWMLPRYGQPDEGGRVHAWYLTADEYDAWASTPIDELERQWAELPEGERRRIERDRRAA